MARKDLTGMVFGRLTVLGWGEDGENRWTCRCSCGKITYSTAGNLTSSKKRSCGCLRDDITRKRTLTHGKSKTAEWQTWYNLFYRLRYDIDRDTQWNKELDLRWEVFENFFEDMGERPSARHRLVRIDVTKPYGPGNVVWMTLSEKHKLETTLPAPSRKYTIPDTKESISEYAKRRGISEATIRSRLNKGYSITEAIAEPFKGKKYRREHAAEYID